MQNQCNKTKPNTCNKMSDTNVRIGYKYKQKWHADKG